MLRISILASLLAQLWFSKLCSIIPKVLVLRSFQLFRTFARNFVFSGLFYWGGGGVEGEEQMFEKYKINIKVLLFSKE
jgi:hypothetical protein